MAFFLPPDCGFSDKLSGFADLKSTVDRGSAEKFGPIPDYVCLEVRIVDRIINFRLPCSVFWCFIDYFVFSFKFLLHGALHSAVPEQQP